jgi:NTE family protein
MSRPKIGLALGSGSARGWSHIGVLESLHKHGITPDIVCGCSIGALVGAAFVAGKIAPLKDWVLGLTWRSVARLVGVGFPNGGLINGDLFKDLMVELDIDASIESFTTPFAAVATDLATGREIWLREGPVHEAVRASMAMPGVFSPAKHGEQWLVDGGLVNPVPVSTCRAQGAEVIIAVNLNANLVVKRRASEVTAQDLDERDIPQPALLEGLLQKMPRNLQQSLSRSVPQRLAPRGSTPRYFDVLASSINIVQDRITRSRLAGEPPHVMLMPRLAHVGLFEFQRAQEAIIEGAACVDRALPDLRMLL